MGRLFIVRGFPGSGKSYLCECARTKVKFELIDPDLIDTNGLEYREFLRDLSLSDIHFKSLSQATVKYRFNLHKAIENLLSGKDVVWCQCWSQLDGIEWTLNEVMKRIPISLYKIIQIDVDPKKSYERFKSIRSGIYSYEEYYKKYVDKYMLMVKGGCTNVITISNMEKNAQVTEDFINAIIS